MPLYEYECESCGHRFERIHQKFSDPPVETCPKCGGKVHKLISSPAIQFKGSGWYITDYSKKSASESAKRESGEGPKTSESSTTDKPSTSTSDTKPASSDTSTSSTSGSDSKSSEKKS